MDDPLIAVIDLLREQHGIAEAKLRPSARIGHDLGVDGDDMYELIEQLHVRFGTDFSALGEQWHEFFSSEGASVRSILGALLLMVPSTAVAVWISGALSLSKWAGGAVGVAVFFGLLVVVSRLFPAKPKRPVTIAGLADVIRAGAWPSDPSEVS